MPAGHSQARALPPPQGFYQRRVVSHSCQERGILAASRAVPQGGFCGTAVTPSGDTRGDPRSRQRLPRSSGSPRPSRSASGSAGHKERASAFCNSASGSTRARFQRNSARFALLRLPASLLRDPVSRCHPPDSRSYSLCEPAPLQPVCDSHTETPLQTLELVHMMSRKN